MYARMALEQASNFSPASSQLILLLIHSHWHIKLAADCICFWLLFAACPIAAHARAINGLLFSQMEFDLACGAARLQQLLASGKLAPTKYRRNRAEYLLRCEHKAWNSEPHAQYKP